MVNIIRWVGLPLLNPVLAELCRRDALIWVRVADESNGALGVCIADCRDKERLSKIATRI